MCNSMGSQVASNWFYKTKFFFSPSLYAYFFSGAIYIYFSFSFHLFFFNLCVTVFVLFSPYCSFSLLLIQFSPKRRKLEVFTKQDYRKLETILVVQIEQYLMVASRSSRYKSAVGQGMAIINNNIFQNRLT